MIPLLAAALLLASAGPAHAYIGPGIGFAIMSSIAAILTALFWALIGGLLLPFRFLFKLPGKFRAALLILLALLIAAGGYKLFGPEPAPEPGRKVVILGFDGMDPVVVESMWREDRLPNLKKLAERGTFKPLATVLPAASPVAWTTFATGGDPEAHGVLDFLIPEDKSYTPRLAFAEVAPAEHTMRFGDWQLPLSGASIRAVRRGQPFWMTLIEHGIPAVVVRVPAAYPPDTATRFLADMGVPDLLGTQGTFTYFTDAPDDIRERQEQGEVIPVRVVNGSFSADIPGPDNPFRVRPAATRAGFRATVDSAQRALTVSIGDTTFTLAEGEWSGFVPLEFRFGLLQRAFGFTQFWLKSVSPNLKLYVSPIQLDPERPVVPLSHPEDYAWELARDVGLYHTIGMPEETWGLNAGVLSDEAFLDHVYQIGEERRRMYELEFNRLQSGLLTCVFVGSDRVSHMFWRYRDPSHPLYMPDAPERSRRAVEDIYEAYDKIVGWTLERMDDRTVLFVVSDHGFSTFRRAVHLNSLLAKHGLLAFKQGASSGELFENVDWPRSRAFALGLNGVYLNARGERPRGIVAPEEREAVMARIERILLDARDPKTGERMITRLDRTRERGKNAPVFFVGYAPGYRASWQTALGGAPEATVEDNDRRWSGDHLIDPVHVPGVFFSSVPVNTAAPRLIDVPPTVLSLFGLTPPPHYSGRTLLDTQKSHGRR